MSNKKEEYPNFYLFLSDALRRDYFPNNLKGTTVPAKAAGHHTPESFTSVLTGLPSPEHGVRKFPECVKVPTLFELEQEGYDVSLWDAENDVTYLVYRFPPRKPLEELEEPFIFIHRDTATHAPYPTDWKQEEMETNEGVAGRVYPNISGPEYIQKMAQGEVDYKQDYQNAVKRAVKYFMQDMKKLKEMGVYDNTFKVFTSDHGDNWPSDPNNGPLAHAAELDTVMNVAVNFYDHDVDIPEELMDSDGEFNIKDIVRVWDSDWDDTRASLHTKGEKEDERTDLESKLKQRMKELGYLEGDETKWRTFVQNRGSEDEGSEDNVPDEEEMKKRLRDLGYMESDDGEGYENYTPDETEEAE